ncbi:hypothetical protein H2248_010577 [Termitomyces sp. 'cryptogamus']|nr:hypothetical protein H2248_010577 [Termitomyces sp. 'cryptogamus']
MHDPDYLPCLEDLLSDSESESRDYKGAFSLYVVLNTIGKRLDGWEDEDDKGMEELTGSDLEHAVVLESAKERDTDHGKPCNSQQSSHVSSLKDLPIFSGAGQLIMYKKKKELSVATKGVPRLVPSSVHNHFGMNL